MGGLGSTRWQLERTKRQADSCLQIVAPRGGPWLNDGQDGFYAWPKYKAVAFFTIYQCSSACYMLELSRKDAPEVSQIARERQAIELEATRPNYGGSRLWFKCPKCQRRSMKLYLPNRERRFLCRLCYNLSYESAQNSGAFYYRLYKMDARRFGVTASVIREAIRSSQGGYVVADLVGQFVPFPPDEQLENNVKET